MKIYMCPYVFHSDTSYQLSCLFIGGLLHELSNDGARQQFNVFLEDQILPHMVLSAQVRFSDQLLFLYI